VSIAGLSVGTQLPPLRVLITPKHIIMGAAASRDWQPQHHDLKWATEAAGLPDIIMNNYTQAGWISRYVTDWCGPQGRIGRLRFSMRGPICPGDELVFAGQVKIIEPGADSIFWLEIGIEMTVGERTVTSATVRLAQPAATAAPSVWQCPAAAWRP
jgi:acyl dehydratase